jgi:hypothetical protein
MKDAYWMGVVARSLAYLSRIIDDSTGSRTDMILDGRCVSLASRQRA